MANSQVRLREMIAELKREGHRLTPQRMAVLQILSERGGHPSAEQMYERVRMDFPMTSLATVYKTVTLLKEMGQVLELGFSDDSNHYDGNRPYPHPHLICVRCRMIVDAGVSGLGGLAQKVASETGYDVIHHRLDFFGICPCCQGRK